MHRGRQNGSNSLYTFPGIRSYTWLKHNNTRSVNPRNDTVTPAVSTTLTGTLFYTYPFLKGGYAYRIRHVTRKPRIGDMHYVLVWGCL